VAAQLLDQAPERRLVGCDASTDSTEGGRRSGEWHSGAVGSSDKQQDLIRFRNLLTVLEGSLRQHHAARDVDDLLAPLRSLADDHGFSNRVLQGLALLRNPEQLRVYRLQRPVPELAIVADSFHTKPLLRIQQSADRYQVLALSRQRARLYEGNRDALAEVELADGVPATPSDLAGNDDRDPERETRIYAASTADGITRHGTGGDQRARENETERYFSAVDRGITEHHSRPS
jgi:hypothetical protein